MRLVRHPIAWIVALFLLVTPLSRLSLASPDHSGHSRYAVILVLDGARPDLFKLAAMPHLHWLMAHGVTYNHAFVGQELAITPTSHATIGTGVFPKRHGVQGFMWKNPQTNQMTRPTDLTPLDAGALDRVMLAHHVPSLAGTVKAVDRSTRVVSVSGHKCYAADAMGTPAADYILCAKIYHDRWVAQAVWTHRPPPGAINNTHFDVPIPNPHSGFAPGVEQWNLGTENAWTMGYALWAFHRIHYPRLLMINLPETDVIGHFAGGKREYLAPLARGFDRELGQLIAAYRKAGLLGRTTFLVTADHGMSVIHARSPFSVYDQAAQLAGATKVDLEADTAGALGIAQLQKAPAVARNVARLGGSLIDATYYKVHDYGWTYRPEHVRPGLSPAIRHAYLTLIDTAAANSSPDIWTVYAPHVTTGDRLANGYHWLAGHLGPQWDEQHIPFIIAGAGVRHDVRSSYPARLVDIAPTLAHLLGARMDHVDGIVLANALQHPTADERKIQAKRGRALTPVVKALEQRSGY